jgi:hypothetical protein
LWSGFMPALSLLGSQTNNSLSGSFLDITWVFSWPVLVDMHVMRCYPVL